MTAIDATRARSRTDDEYPLPTTLGAKPPVQRELPEGLDQSHDLARRVQDAKNMLAAQVLADQHALQAKATVVERPVLIVDGISPTDVRQAASVGDCTVEATLASLARTPKGQAWLASRIKTERDAQGEIVGFTVLLKVRTDKGYVDQPVAVDARKFVLGHDLTKNAKGEGEVWPLVWEAAISQQVGGHAVLGAGSDVPTSSAFITGLPAVDSVPRDDKSLGPRMLADFDAGRLQTLSTGLTVPGANPAGLAPAHAYTVMDVRSNQPVLQPDGTTKLETLVYLRNPWGTNDPRPMTIAEVQRDFGAYSVGDVP